MCAAALATLVTGVASDAALLTSGEVIGARHVAAADVIAATGLTGTRAFRASAADARDRVRALPAVRDARVDIDVLGTFAVTLDERRAIGRWAAAGVEWFVDDEGVLFPSRDASAAPALRVIDLTGRRHTAGERLDPALVRAALRLAALAPGELRADMTAPRVRIDPQWGIVLESGSRWEIRFGAAEGLDDKLKIAREFLKNEPQRTLDYVDVRSPERIVFSPR